MLHLYVNSRRELVHLMSDNMEHTLTSFFKKPYIYKLVFLSLPTHRMRRANDSCIVSAAHKLVQRGSHRLFRFTDVLWPWLSQSRFHRWRPLLRFVLRTVPDSLARNRQKAPINKTVLTKVRKQQIRHRTWANALFSFYSGWKLPSSLRPCRFSFIRVVVIQILSCVSNWTGPNQVQLLAEIKLWIRSL